MQLIASSLCSGQFWAMLIAWVSVKLCDLRQSSIVYIHVVWERLGGLFQSSSGDVQVVKKTVLVLLYFERKLSKTRVIVKFNAILLVLTI